MSPCIDITNQRFGRLLVIARAGLNSRNQAIWTCRCDCGAMMSAITAALKNGNTKSCGCLNREACASRVRARQITHGHAARGKKSPEFRSWTSMRLRCRYAGNPGFKHYGGRGITVCERWLKFENFLADMGPKPKGLTLERINNDRGYEPNNCRWATVAEQNRNTSRNNFIEANGERLCITDWAAKLGVTRATIIRWFRCGTFLDRVRLTA